jgi:iron transport multicopper oxidase
VHDPEDPYKGLYDEEVVMTLSDWYHDQMPGLLKDFISIANPSGAEPVPQAALLNDTQNLAVRIQPGKTYLFRLINMGAFAAQYVWFEGHTMRIVEGMPERGCRLLPLLTNTTVDGIYTEPTEAEMIYVTAAQRYSVLVTAKNDTTSNFAFVGSMDQVRLWFMDGCSPQYALIINLGSLRCHTCGLESERDWMACLR